MLENPVSVGLALTLCSSVQLPIPLPHETHHDPCLLPLCNLAVQVFRQVLLAPLNKIIRVEVIRNLLCWALHNSRCCEKRLWKSLQCEESLILQGT